MHFDTVSQAIKRHAFSHTQHSRFYTIHPAHLNADCWAQQTPKEAQFQKHVHKRKHVPVTGPMVPTPAKSLNLYVVQGIKDVGGGRCLLIQTRGVYETNEGEMGMGYGYGDD